MKPTYPVLIAVTLLAFACPRNAHADVVDDAYKVCAAMENTGLTTSCKVDGWKGAIDVRIDTSSTEARKICEGVAEMMAQQTGSFRDGRWKLQIFSPYSGDQPVAVCKLR